MMTKTMARRGPDASGVWIDRHVGLGHRRLAVIDLAGGVQPMQAEELGQTTVSLIYTGEVYNFVELRDELKQLGHQFKTRSDTEVVLRGYLQWGEEVAERLNGMFAFAGGKTAFLLPYSGWRAVRLRAESDPCAPQCAATREQGWLSRVTRARKESRIHNLRRHVRGAAGTGRAREPQRVNETALLDAHCA